MNNLRIIWGKKVSPGLLRSDKIKKAPAVEFVNGVRKKTPDL